MAGPNLLYYGDNLDVLRRHVKDESVDLVYLDPPFNSNVNYNVLFQEHGEKAAAQIEAFTDTWEWNSEAAAAYQEVVEEGGEVAKAMIAFRALLGTSDMLAYLSMMAPRLVELRRVLKPSGSLYLHCDPTASHYLKLLLDATFDPRNFRNEIVWKRSSAHSDTTQGAVHLGRTHDVLLFYTKSDEEPTRNVLHVPFTEEYIESHYSNVEPGTGRRYRKGDLTAAKPGGDTLYDWAGPDGRTVRPYKGRYWAYTKDKMAEFERQGRLIYTKSGMPEYKRYLDDNPGTPVQDIWDDIPPINSQAKERLGWATQKPEALLKRIIGLSSNPGDIVLDPFCGCGTTVDAAQSLGRRWVGIDITHLAIGLIKHRLVDRYGPDIAKTYRTVGEPTTLDDARALAEEDPFQFQAWALGLVGARVAGSDKKGGDKGIDGRLYFHEGASQTRQIVFSVKAGHLVPAFIRDLSGVLTREGAEIGVLISFEEPSSGMRAEAADSGFHKSPWGQHPRIQLRTVGDLLAGKGVDYPHVTGANVTHRRAVRAAPDQAETLELFAPAPGEGPDPPG